MPTDEPDAARTPPGYPAEPPQPSSFLRLVVRRDVVRRSLKYAASIGTILALINHFDLLAGVEFTPMRAIKIALTYCVPYAVTTVASVQALRSEGC